MRDAVTSLELEPAEATVGHWTPLCGLFFLSGVSGLFYEVVWVRMLTRVLGNTVSATSIVLSAFMAGLGLGSLLIGRRAARFGRPLALYAVLELGIGVTALLSLVLSARFLPFYRMLYRWVGESRVWLGVAEAATASLFLLIPTALMGATLPALCSFGARQGRDFARHVGVLYALNCFGAVVGVLFAGFVLIGELGESGTVALGAAINFTVAVAALVLDRTSVRGDAIGPPKFPSEGGTDFDEPGPMNSGRGNGRRIVLAAVAGGGFVALGSQVIWGRMLLLYQGTSIYSFSAVLAVILAGMGLGSLAGAKSAGSRSDTFRAFGFLHLCVGLFSLISLHLFGQGVVVKPDLVAGTNLGVMALAPILFLGPLGFLWGAIFPTAVSCYGGTDDASGSRRVAELYACNTLGCIVGAASAGFVLIPAFGVSVSAAALGLSSVAISIALLAARPEGFRLRRCVPEACLALVCLLLAGTLGDPYHQLLSRHMRRLFPAGVTEYRYDESPSGTTTAFGAARDPRVRQLWIDGEGMTVLVPVTKLMAHLPLWLAEDPKDALVICFGMGTTVRSASRHAGLDVSAVELVPAVFDCVQYFHSDGPDILRKPNVHPRIDDGRNYLALHDERYDVITVDPAPPLYSAGTVNLYSLEFFRLCRARLRPGGVVCLWVPEGSTSEVKAIIKTFVDVFEGVTVWNSPMPNAVGGCYLLGAPRPFRDIAGRIRRGFKVPAVVEDLREWGDECASPEKVLDLLIADRATLVPWLSDAVAISDDHPYTEFPLWRAVLGTTDYYVPFNGERLRRKLKFGLARAGYE